MIYTPQLVLYSSFEEIKNSWVPRAHDGQFVLNIILIPRNGRVVLYQIWAD